MSPHPLSLMRRTPCGAEGCDREPIPCYLLGGVPGVTKPDEWYCPQHAEENGYCRSCGTFCGGMESFEFIHPGYCDNCHDQLHEDDDPNDDDWYPEGLP
jgi:hypothetical protein